MASRIGDTVLTGTPTTHFCEHKALHPSLRVITRLWSVVLDLVSTHANVRRKLENALATAREIKAHAPHCRVILTVYELKQLGRDAAELTVLADHLTAHGLVLEMLAGPLAGIYDPAGPRPDGSASLKR